MIKVIVPLVSIIVLSFLSNTVLAKPHTLTTMEYLYLTHIDPKDLTDEQRAEMTMYEMGVRTWSDSSPTPQTEDNQSITNRTISPVKTLDGVDVTSVTRGNHSSLP